MSDILQRTPSNTFPLLNSAAIKTLLKHIPFVLIVNNAAFVQVMVYGYYKTPFPGFETARYVTVERWDS